MYNYIFKGMVFNLNIKLLNENATPIKRQTEGAAGFDIAACLDDEYVTIQPGETKIINSGVAIALPKKTVGLIYVRSSIGIKRSLCLANGTGVIDEDYRGELMIALHNFGKEPQSILNHERIAQLVITKYIDEDVNIVDELDDTERGAGGIGSTGQ